MRKSAIKLSGLVWVVLLLVILLSVMINYSATMDTSFVKKPKYECYPNTSGCIEQDGRWINTNPRWNPIIK